MNATVAPPVGLRPERIYLAAVKEKQATNLKTWRKMRVGEITTAITNYTADSKPVPREWLNELRRLTK